MKITLQIEVDNATDAGNLVALAQLLRGGDRTYTFVFDEVVPALSNVLRSINILLLNTPDLKTRIELQKIFGDPMLLVRVQKDAEWLSERLKSFLLSAGGGIT